MDKKIFTIDGNKFSDYKGFVEEFCERIFGDQLAWGGGFASLNDLLRDEPLFAQPITIHWVNAHKSKEDLGYAATLAWLESSKEQVHPSNKELWAKRIELMKNRIGDTIFQILVDIILSHKNITLILD